jgi:hypothetical protein
MSPKTTGRVIGALLVVQLAGLIVPFAMLHPIAPSRFLAQGAAADSQIQLAVLLLVANCALAVGIAALAWPTFRRHSSALAALLLVVGGVMFSLQAVDGALVKSMVAVSHQYVEAGSRAEPVQALAAVVETTRRSVHYWALFAIDAWIFLLYGILYRSRLVPRGLAAFGILTVLLHFGAITGPLLLGLSTYMPLGATMAISHLALAGWLLVKGFPVGAEASELPG